MVMEELKGKRLLVLGGSLWKEAIRDFADTYGVTIIATGNDTSAGIFKIADEGYNVNSTDHEGMKKLIMEKNIDGVYMGGSEAVISAACVYLGELGYPCYCTKEQWEFLQNKKNFKELCTRFDVPVVPKYDVTCENIDSQIEKIDFPVITKPADSCGSDGFSVCYNGDDLKRGYDFAAKNSSTGSVVVEKFVKNKGVVVFYTFSNGRMHFSGLEDKYPIRYTEGGSYVGGMFAFESRFTEEYRKLFDKKLEKMFASIGIREGSIWIEVFHDGEEYYFNEVGFRYGGSISVYPVDYLYGINQVHADMYYALTGKSNIRGYNTLIPEKIERKKHYCVYPIYVSDGYIASVEGEAEVRDMKDVVSLTLTKGAGDTVAKTGSFSQIFALVHFVANDLCDLEKTVDEIHSKLKALAENGENKLYKIIPPDIIL